MQAEGLEDPPCTVTSEYTVKLLRPTPMNTPLKLVAELDRIKGHRAIVKGKLFADEKLCDTCVGTFVSVPPDHPGYHRW